MKTKHTIIYYILKFKIFNSKICNNGMEMLSCGLQMKLRLTDQSKSIDYQET